MQDPGSCVLPLLAVLNRARLIATLGHSRALQGNTSDDGLMAALNHHLAALAVSPNAFNIEDAGCTWHVMALRINIL